MLKIQCSKSDDTWLNFGERQEFAKEYRNLSLKEGCFFLLMVI